MVVVVYPGPLTAGWMHGIAVMASLANAVLRPRLERKHQRRSVDTLTGNVARHMHGLANRDPRDVQQGDYAACARA
jgi:hypothetical protein